MTKSRYIAMRYRKGNGRNDCIFVNVVKCLCVVNRVALGRILQKYARFPTYVISSSVNLIPLHLSTDSSSHPPARPPRPPALTYLHGRRVVLRAGHAHDLLSGDEVARHAALIHALVYLPRQQTQRPAVHAWVYSKKGRAREREREDRERERKEST